MRLHIKRDTYTAKSTTGILSIDGTPFCFTLEDVVRPDGVKIPGETAIPAGTYNVVVTYSNRFKRELPLLLAVPNFVGVRIHAGNTDADTEGCILVGQSRGNNVVNNSRAAFNPLFARITAALASGDTVMLTIENDAVSK